MGQISQKLARRFAKWSGRFRQAKWLCSSGTTTTRGWCPLRLIMNDGATFPLVEDDN